MNEQLIVKNFGPIKDATVDFKRVTVFIGPTGGGKSTLAKLAAVFSNPLFLLSKIEKRIDYLSELGIDTYLKANSYFTWFNNIGKVESGYQLDFNVDSENIKSYDDITQKALSNAEESIKSVLSFLTDNGGSKGLPRAEKTFGIDSTLKAAKLIVEIADSLGSTSAKYFIAERAFVSALTYSWPGFLRDDIGLPKALLFFANSFSASRLTVAELEIPFLNIKYIHQDGQDFIKSVDSETLFRLFETASGIQSVTPLLVLLEHLSRNTEQAQSFIIEEPELNLYPTAQQGLLNWLVEKCTQGENDLTITTHSPYILSHLNFLLYAHHVGNKDEEKRRKVDAIIPEKYWVNPDEFAAYYVNGPEGAGGVRSLLDPETKLISQNELDAVSGIQADEFDQLLDINRGF